MRAPVLGAALGINCWLAPDSGTMYLVLLGQLPVLVVNAGTWKLPFVLLIKIRLTLSRCMFVLVTTLALSVLADITWPTVRFSPMLTLPANLASPLVLSNQKPTELLSPTVALVLRTPLVSTLLVTSLAACMVPDAMISPGTVSPVTVCQRGVVTELYLCMALLLLGP